MPAKTPHRTLQEALKGADVFIGLSVKGALKPQWLKSMAPRPIVFALANPDPEILPDEAKKARPDVIVATGRSDFPNQVNNVLGFPFLFRGALDVRARDINKEMKLAAVYALANLARQTVPPSVSQAYQGERFQFGPDYIIPKPFDFRILTCVAPAGGQSGCQKRLGATYSKGFYKICPAVGKSAKRKAGFCTGCDTPCERLQFPISPPIDFFA